MQAREGYREKEKGRIEKMPGISSLSGSLCVDGACIAVGEESFTFFMQDIFLRLSSRRVLLFSEAKAVLY